MHNVRENLLRRNTSVHKDRRTVLRKNGYEKEAEVGGNLALN